MLKKITQILFVLVLSALSYSAWSAIEVYDFDTQEQEERFKKLSDEMRCPLCLNSNLSGSDAGIAADLRNEIHEQIVAGKTNDEIVEFMTVRYGDFINYRPPLNRGTFFLWFGPALLLLAGFLIVVRILKANRSNNTDDQLSPDENEKLAKILSSGSDTSDT